MALFACSECGREISDKAISCPGCGCPVIRVEDGAPVSDFDVRTYLETNNLRGAMATFRVANEFHYQKPVDLVKAKYLYEYIVSTWEGGDNAKSAKKELDRLGMSNPELFSGTMPKLVTTDAISNSNAESVLMDVIVGLTLGATIFYMFMFVGSSVKGVITPFLLAAYGMYLRFTYKRNKSVLVAMAGMFSGFFLPVAYIFLQ